MRRFFDPAAYRIVLFDQRNAGRSRPHASDPAVDLTANTTEHLLGDIERLREHLDVERWVLFGTSWGSALGLAYAERNTARVTAMVLSGVAVGRRAEIDWLYRGVGPQFADAYERFRNGAPADQRDGDLVEAYHSLLNDPDPAVRARAAKDFTEWEWALSSVDPDAPLVGRWADPDFQLGRARIVTHYFRHNCWLADDELIGNADRLGGIPGGLVMGRHDAQVSLAGARDLVAAWPDAELVVVDDAGHSVGDPGMGDAIAAATDRFR